MKEIYLLKFTHHAQLPVTDIFGIWIAAFLTLCIFSFLYKDNPLYKFAEHLFVGVSAGYQVTILYQQYLKVKMVDPFTDVVRDYYHLLTLSDPQLSQKLLEIKSTFTSSQLFVKYGLGSFVYYILPSLIGLMILTRMIKGVEWMSKYPIAYYIGYGTGVTIMIKIHSDILEQLNASIKSIPVLMNLGTFHIISYVIFLIGLCCSLIYFYFSSPQKNMGMRVATKIGIWVLMITFGAQFGFTIMARISLLIGRMQFLLGDWLGLIS